MKRNGIIVFILVLAVSVLAQNPKKSFKNGKKLFELSQYTEAIEQFSLTLKHDASYIEAYVLRAKAYEETNKLDLAAKDFEKAADLAPNSVDYFFNAGKLNYLIKEYPKALHYLTEAVIHDNAHFQAYQFKSFTHIKLDEYENAIVSINHALDLEETYLCYYTRGVANDSLKNYAVAISDYKKAISLNSDYKKAYLALTKAYIKNKQLDQAIENANKTVKRFPRTAEAYEVRSLTYYERGELLRAINDLSKLETMVDEADRVLFTRGIYYFESKQFQNAKSDFSQIIALAPDTFEAFYWRGRANEEMMEEQRAAFDYNTFITLANANNFKLYTADAISRLYEINREQNAPIIAITSPKIIQENKLAVLNSADRILIEGIITDCSKIDSFTINKTAINLTTENTFSTYIDIANINTVTIQAIDVYNNKTTVVYNLLNAENDIPLARITSPYAGDNNEIYLDSNDPNLFIEGYIEDKSTIKEIFVNNIRASYNDTEANPQFSALININGQNTISLKAIDNFNNILETTYTLNREGAVISENNPMGKTWVVFIENSNYESFSSLEGPGKDVNNMKNALSGYEIHNFIHKKNMNKEEMERFFSIELRDQVKKNNVNSLLVWYAGHGKSINQTGYWIPVDALPDDEFTYFNINSLKAGMQSYSGFITHTLIVTDACESGPSFYLAMRSGINERACDDVSATQFKSAQVFSSAGEELASDDSYFTKAFAKSLLFNDNACIPIETIVKIVTEATAGNGNQKPQFGKISGFEDENGTFFFIKK